MSYPQNIKVTVDAVVFSFQNDALQVLLIQRKNDPFKGQWAIPGGFAEDDESLDAAAKRELQEETGTKLRALHQFHTFGKPDRDPRGRTISVAYLILADHASLQPKAASDAQHVKWFSTDALPPLAFDHSHIIKKALAELKNILTSAINQTQTKKINNDDFEKLKTYFEQMYL